MNVLSNITPVEPFEFTLTAAAPSVRFPVTAEFIICKAAQEDFDVLLNRGNKAFPLGQNGEYRMPLDAAGRRFSFDFVEFRRRAAAVLANNAVTVLIGSGEYKTGAVSLAAATTATPAATLNGANPDVALVAATNTLLVAANSARRLVRIRNRSTVDSLRLSSNVADLTAGNRGDELLPGEVIELAVSGAIYGRSAGTPPVSIGEEVY